MFDNLSTRLEGIVKKIRGKGRLTEADVDEVMKEIRTALLEADVNVTVVRSVCNRIREAAIGATRSGALDPAQQVVKAVNDELTRALGGETLAITYASKPPTVVLMAGLQGSGKTTNSAKLAAWFKAQGRQPLLVGADLQRPAAVEQLRTLGRQIDVPVFSDPSDPVRASAAGLEEAKRLGRDVVIVDTAGRLSIDAEMMEQVRQISATVQPDYTFLVVDAMTGQDAVQTAEAFHETLADRRRDHVEDGRRRPRRRGAVGQGGHRSADRLRLDRREARPSSSSSTPTAWRGASSAWATCSR